MNNCLLLLSCEGSRTLPPAMPEPLLSSSFLFYYFRVVLVVYIIILSFNISSQPQEPSIHPQKETKSQTDFVRSSHPSSSKIDPSLSLLLIHCHFVIFKLMLVCVFVNFCLLLGPNSCTYIPTSHCKEETPASAWQCINLYKLFKEEKISQAQIPQ